MLSEFRKLSKVSKINCIVLFLHLLLLCVFHLSASSQVSLLPKSKVLVRTVYLKKSEPVTPQEESRKVKKLKPIKTKPKVQKKITHKAKPIVSKEKQRHLKKQRDLLVSLKKSLDKIDDAPDKPIQEAAAVNIQKQVELKIEHLSALSLAKEEERYQDAMVNYLQQYLKFPEFGSVKIRLHVMMDGYIKEVEILNSESKLNRKYIETAVPGLSFPPFAKRFKGVEKKTFVITLKNAF